MNTSQAIGRMREVIRRQRKALSTEDSYVFWLRRYMTALRQMPKDLSSQKKLEPEAQPAFATASLRTRPSITSTYGLRALFQFETATYWQPALWPMMPPQCWVI